MNLIYRVSLDCQHLFVPIVNIKKKYFLQSADISLNRKNDVWGVVHIMHTIKIKIDLSNIMLELDYDSYWRCFARKSILFTNFGSMNTCPMESRDSDIQCTESTKLHKAERGWRSGIKHFETGFYKAVLRIWSPTVDLVAVSWRTF